jgi:RimJ/RimL family protein N-acetyltransferase
MVTTAELLKAAYDASLGFLKSPSDRARPSLRASGTMPLMPSAAPPTVVPIRSLGPGHAGRIAEHLLALSPSDRYLRFGYAANDEQIQRYVDGLDFDRDDIFGIYNRRLTLIAVAHLAFSVDPSLNSCAEFGVSVLAHARGRGYGARLFDRAMMHARNDGVRMMFIHALSENTAMLNIARKAGATIEREGAESQAYLKLPPADLDSRMSEMVDEQFAQSNYRLKVQARQFWDLLALIQEVRSGVREARTGMPR